MFRIAAIVICSGLVSVSLSWAQTAIQRTNLFDEFRLVENTTLANGLMYAACSGGGLRIFDVSNPSNPQLIGSLNTAGDTHRVMVEGNTAFLADHGSFRSVDVSDPAHPVELDALEFGEVMDVVIQGDYAYLASGWGHVRVVDIYDPENLVPVAQVGSGYVRFLDLDGNRLCYTSAENGMFAAGSLSIDVPESPVAVSYQTLPAEPFRLNIIGDRVYVPLGHSGVQILALDPESAELSPLSSFDTNDYAQHVEYRSEDVVMVADGNAVRFYDVSDVFNVINTGPTWLAGAPCVHVISSDGLYYASGLENGIFIANEQFGVFVLPVSHIGTGRITDLASRDNKLYVINERRNMSIVDVADVGNPVYQGVLTFPDFPKAIVAHPVQPLVYLALDAGGIAVVDVSDPEDPFQILRVTTSGPAYGLFLQNDLLVTCNWNGGVQLYDVSDPGMPVIQSTLAFPRETDRAYVSGNLMAVVTRPDWGVEGGSIHLFDISDIGNPVLLSQVTYEDREVGDVCIDSGYLYVTAWDLPTRIYDIGDPGNPIEIGTVAAQAIGMDLEVQDGILFASQRENGFRFYDVSDPLLPVVLPDFRTDFESLGFELAGSNLFVATGYYVQVLDVSALLPASGEPDFLALDPCEESLARWSLSSNGTQSLLLDDQQARLGGYSLKATTAGDIMTIAYTADGTRSLDLQASSHLRVWMRVENDQAFQLNSPRIRLGSGSDYIEYSPTTNLLSGAYSQWLEVVMPLAGGTGWTRSEHGMSTLESVRWIEFYSDTWDYAYTWWLDGLRFDPAGSVTDCNGNFLADAIDVLNGSSQDLNGNGLPDECEECVLPLVDITLPYTGSGNTINTPDVIGSPAGEVAYRFTLNATATVAFNSCHPGTGFDTDSYLFAGAGPCDGGTQLLFNSEGVLCTTRPGASQWTQADLPAGTYVLLLTGTGSEEGGFVFTLQSPFSQELPVDAATQLLLRFNNNTTGVQGETPSLSSGVSYATGRVAQGASLSTGDRLTYSRTNNITATQGTVEAWIKPEWNGNDGLSHWLLSWGTSGGLLMGKDGANNWRIILNRFGNGGQPENGVSTNVGGWLANQWHHVAFTWDAAFMRVYVDGSLAAEGPVTITLPAITTSTFQIGGEGTGSSLRAVVDEFRISNVARTAQQIADDYARGLQILAFYADPDEISLYPTWQHTPSLTALTDLGAVPVPALLAQWSSANPGVATVSVDGRITALAGGTAVVSATYQGQVAPITVTVTPPLLQPIVETLDPFLTTPAADALYDMPVVIISYLPTQDGVHLDANLAAWGNPLVDMRQQIAQKDIRVKFALEEGSKFRGFDNPDAQPSLGYRVVEKTTVFEPLPLGPGGPDVFQPDYEQILNRFDARHWVEDLGVKEIWLWGYHHGNISPVESNMSSPTTGDVSNSYRLDDLPVYDRTYVLYNYNFTRSQAEAVHDHGHQLEAILSHVNWLQDGNSNLFWRQFSGRNASDTPITGRCGNTHMPPNTTNHYDYLNPATVASDIRQWLPSGGPTTPVNVHTWGDHPYAWPYGEWNFGQREETQWYIFWMQSMPGFLNTIPYNSTTMTNWWAFTADWDAAIQGDLGLYGAPTPAAPLLTAQAQGSHMLLQWNPVGDVNYLVYRAADPGSPFEYLGRTADTNYLDTDALASTGRAVYRVIASFPAID